MARDVACVRACVIYEYVFIYMDICMLCEM